MTWQPLPPLTHGEYIVARAAELMSTSDLHIGYITRTGNGEVYWKIPSLGTPWQPLTDPPKGWFWWPVPLDIAPVPDLQQWRVRAEVSA